MPASWDTGGVSTVERLSERLEFLQGTLEVLILRSLALGPNHAYGISQFLQQESDHEFLVDNGSLYPALQRLLQRGWIAAQWKTSPNARRAKYYRLTPAGRKQLWPLRRNGGDSCRPWAACSLRKDEGNACMVGQSDSPVLAQPDPASTE